MLSSAKNPKVAGAIRLKKRAYRDEDRRFLVEGAQGVREALDLPWRSRRCSLPSRTTRSRSAHGSSGSR
ncbi:MAG: hypothetical protein U0V56_04815 [Actinomycetota bacterium]